MWPVHGLAKRLLGGGGRALSRWGLFGGSLRRVSGSRPDQDTTVTEVKKPLPEQSGHDFLLVIYANDKSAQGSRLMLEAGLVRVGRMSDSEIVLEDNAVSRRHARIERREDGYVVMDVGSRNGTLLNDREISDVVKLSNGDRLQIGSTIFKYIGGNEPESAFYEEIYQMMITDSLTQVRNRRHFDDVIEREFSRARRFGRPLSLLILDIDFFKRVNDDYGHLVGDAVLREVAQLIHTRVRRDDTVVRYGGEEFVVLMPETPIGNATSLAAELCAAIAAHVIAYRGARLSVSVSVGCAELLEGDDVAGDLVRRADERLYAAKHAGRNRVMW
jgi:diguanylate cyclase (GGDEF)-like protein